MYGDNAGLHGGRLELHLRNGARRPALDDGICCVPGHYSRTLHRVRRTRCVGAIRQERSCSPLLFLFIRPLAGSG